MRRLIGVVALATVLATATVGSAAADGPANAQCWGVVTSQRATAVGDIGTHSAAQEEPRSGLGNLARDLGLHVSDVGTFLAGIDELDATSCP